MTDPRYKTPAGERAVMAFYGKLLDQWPVPYDTLTIPTRHGNTFVIACGRPSDPPLVLLHGSASNSFSWMGDVPEYCRSFRVYAVDIPGEPGRSDANRLSWTGPAFAEWLEDLLDGLHAPSAALAGLSQGGFIALKLATRQPERVSKLVLLAPAGVVPARLSFLLRVIPLTLFGRPGAEAINRIIFGKQQIHPTAVEFMNLIMTHFKPRIGAQPLFTDEELARLTMPTLLVAGGQDPILPADKMAERLRRLAPRFTELVLPDHGHALVNLAQEILPFLSGAAMSGTGLS